MIEFGIFENASIPLADGRILAARIWLPESADTEPAPAILEYLPYRKRDGTAQRDEATYPEFARAGYAGVRVDISGTGESDGSFDDEYSPRELADGVAVIEWIAEQDWCDGNIGMMGISWGGFNSLQIAALQPEALKAVIAIGTTVDRYNDDIHYKNGCLLYSNFWWSSVMLGFVSRPPDPYLTGEIWRDNWLQRLRSQPFPLHIWLRHQRRDEYWQHGSICEDYSAVRIPALVVSGWADGYVNAPPACTEHLPNHGKAIIGPWIHQYPHFALPRPRMDFVSEALHWWDRWLKGKDRDAFSLPDYRAFILKGVRPGEWRDIDPGRWVAETAWPSENIKDHLLYPGGENTLEGSVSECGVLDISSPLDCGINAGEFFPLKPDAELAGDQQNDDAGSLVFDTPVLEKALEILGRPVLKLKVSIDKPVGNLIARLVDLHPDGVGYRVSWGVLNLCHRYGNADPEEMLPGEAEEVTVVLDQCGYQFPAGHRIRLSLSTNYWPTILPPPEMVTARIYLERSTCLVLPERKGGEDVEVPEPPQGEPLPSYPQLSEPFYRRQVARNDDNGITSMEILDDSGEVEIPDHGMVTRYRHENHWSVAKGDPLSASMQATFTCHMSRGNWRIRTESTSSLTCDRSHFHIQATVSAFENEERVSEKHWSESIPRDHM